MRDLIDADTRHIDPLYSFADLQYMDGELDDGKACASVGQGSLMALYDAMFSQV